MNQRDDDDEGVRRPQPGAGDKADPTEPRPSPDPRGGLDREVGDLEDPDAERDDGALPGRAGGGLAGG